VNTKRLAQRILKSFAALAILGLLGVAVLFLALWLEHRTSVTLPTPSGSFAVSREIYDWVDDKTPDPLCPVPGAKRELLVWIWYPASSAYSTDTADYLPTPMREVVERGNGVLISKFLTKDLSKVRPHSLRNAEVAAQRPSYPVVLLRAGASLEVANYSTLAEDLASHGYVVVGFDAPYRSFAVVFPDGRVMTRLPENNPELCLEKTGADRERCAVRLLSAWTSDSAFVLDRLQEMNSADAPNKFKGRLDMTRVGIVGHSFGGAAAALFCRDDSRCRAVIDLDGAPLGNIVQSGIDRPFLFLLSDHSRESDPETRQIKADIQSIYNRLPPDSRQVVTIRGANHFTFTDDGALLKSHFIRGAFRALGKLGIDGDRQLAVTSYCVCTFFDKFLKGQAAAPSKISSARYPEIQSLE
jgi:predicted dienelactone hydrolase